MTTPMSSTVCAWKEGWADWVAVRTFGETHLPIAAGRLVEVRTTWNEQGVPAALTVVPRNGQDLDLVVMAPDAAAWGLPRSAARKSASGGPNRRERVTISDPKVTGLYAVVVVSKAGDGNVLLTRV
uniref:Uncharacterized protein n=2 Tax=Nonomuraea gerenzanensis TaxID=93944 RepID=A0A1M4EE62_9ACTN|nr:hypothetical protein BN4615_P6379 [Nonomuraea gerenzanensis]